MGRGKVIAKLNSIDINNYTVKKLAPEITTFGRPTDASEHLSHAHYIKEEPVDLAVRLSTDHKPTTPAEIFRIESMGGMVVDGRL